VVRVWPLDQARVDPGSVAAEAEIVLAPRNLDLILGAEQTLDLCERLRRHDQIDPGRPRRLRGDAHAGEAVPVRRDHPHLGIAELPEDAVEDRAALLRGDRVRGLTDQHVEDFAADLPALAEIYGRERGELIPGKPVQPKRRPAARQLETIAFPGDAGRV